MTYESFPQPPQYQTFPPSSDAGDDTPFVVMAASTVAWWRADLGITQAGGVVSSWLDLSGNGFHLIQAVGANQPAYNATGGPNSTPSLLFDGSNDFLTAAIDRPAPGTTPTFVWQVLRQVTWTSNERLWGFGVAFVMLLVQVGSSPSVTQNNGVSVNANTGLTLNTYKRGETYFANSAADYLKLGATKVTGNTAGNSDPSAVFNLGIDGGAFGPANIEVAELAIFSALPSAAQLARLDAYCTARYGVGLT